MVRWSRSVSLSVMIAALSIAISLPAFAIYPKLQSRLTGPAINGVVPEGDARVDQSKLPAQPGTLEVRVKNVNLPDGTVLDVEIGGKPFEPEPYASPGMHVGTITLQRREGMLFTTLPSGYSVGRAGDPIVLRNRATGAIILSGGRPWQV